MADLYTTTSEPYVSARRTRKESEVVGKIYRGPNGQKLRRPTKAQREKADLAKERMLAHSLDQAYPELFHDASKYVDQIESLSSLANEIESGSELVKLGVEAVQMLSRVQHLQTVIGAYAFWIKSSTQRPYQLLVRVAAARREAKPNSKHNRKTTSLHLIVESMVSYGESEGDVRSHSRLYSRDVQAIRWLNHHKIPPTEALELSQQRGEGLNAWAKRWAEHEKEAKSTTSGSESEKDARPSTGTPNERKPISFGTTGNAVSTLPVGEASDAANLSNDSNGSDPFGFATEDSVEIMWTFSHSGVSKKLKLVLTERSSAKITACLDALSEIDLSFRKDPLGG